MIVRLSETVQFRICVLDRTGCLPRLWRVQFDEDLPEAVGPGSVASLDGWDASEAVVERSHLHHGLYGLRWKSSSGWIEGNTISANYIEVTPLLFYMEGPFQLDNISIVNNTLPQCAVA